MGLFSSSKSKSTSIQTTTAIDSRAAATEGSIAATQGSTVSISNINQAPQEMFAFLDRSLDSMNTSLASLGSVARGAVDSSAGQQQRYYDAIKDAGGAPSMGVPWWAIAAGLFVIYKVVT